MIIVTQRSVTKAALTVPIKGGGRYKIAVGVFTGNAQV